MIYESQIALIISTLPKRVRAYSKEELILYFATRLARIYNRNITLKTRERRDRLLNSAEGRRKQRLRLGLSLKPALSPALRERLDEIDKRLGFS